MAKSSWHSWKRRALAHYQVDEVGFYPCTPPSWGRFRFRTLSVHGHGEGPVGEGFYPVGHSGDFSFTSQSMIPGLDDVRTSFRSLQSQSHVKVETEHQFI